MRSRTVGLIVAILVAIVVAACLWWRSRPSYVGSFIQSQDRDANQPFTFYAKVVDQDGAPVAGAYIYAYVHRYNEDWDPDKGSANRGANYAAELWSDRAGFAVLNGYGESIYQVKVIFPGYDWLFDKETSGGNGQNGYWLGNLTAFNFTPGGKRYYIPDPDRPAVFVLVQKGKKVVRVSPAPGGSLTPRNIRGQPVILPPTWPRKPSIPGVRFELPTTLPSTGP